MRVALGGVTGQGGWGAGVGLGWGVGVCESRGGDREGIARWARAGAERVILGWTEIELLISAADSPVPLFPTTRLHVEAAVDASLAGISRG